MKKLITILAAAVCCFTSCLMQSETDCIYQISAGTDANSQMTVDPSESYNLIKEYNKAYSEFVQSFSNNQWVVTVRNEAYKNHDTAAKKKFETVAAQYREFNKTWQAKFDACTDTKSKLESAYHLKLARTSADGTVELAREDFKLSLNK